MVVEDGGFPILSSTGTLSVRVCACDPSGSVLTCSADAFLLPLGLSPGALLAILLCVIILLGKRPGPPSCCKDYKYYLLTLLELE